MTRGEAWYANKLKFENSKILSIEEDDRRFHVPAKMSKKEASKYYRAKLFNYWVDNHEYDKKASKTRIKQTVSLFMFNNLNGYKKYKELV